MCQSEADGGRRCIGHHPLKIALASRATRQYGLTEDETKVVYEEAKRRARANTTPISDRAWGLFVEAQVANASTESGMTEEQRAAEVRMWSLARFDAPEDGHKKVLMHLASILPRTRPAGSLNHRTQPATAQAMGSRPAVRTATAQRADGGAAARRGRTPINGHAPDRVEQQASPLNVRDVTFSSHFLKQAASKGFTAEQIKSALENPEKITDVLRHPGQKRYCGAGVAVVVDGKTAITAYLDGVVTELRPDQMNDEAALNSRRLAAR